MDRLDPLPTSPAEILRLLGNLLRVGTVAAVDHKAARCRVRTGNLTTAWAPWFALRAGGEQGRLWWPPAVGEQCLVLCPGGDTGGALVLCGIPSDALPAGSNSPTEARTDWSAQSRMVHDRAGESLVIECPGSITLRCGETELRLTPEGATITPDIVGGGRVSLVHHLHGGVRKGTDQTGEPA
ncbi:phage baseplate assembly protein V [Paracidovorax avenae]|uniref:phage baseplate assembly protein V n=1 Tax=Paracidovorax avenae TaxID=80867 RepID=UPI000D20F028|nr:phage baseplate assembly protein V [Paracidovorax avenae]AVS66643.1 phage baseplate assembly protein V [Paracidovorax avenae]